MGVADILRKGAEVYETKNQDYGDSWRKVGESMALWSNNRPVVLRTPNDFIRFALFARRLDKMIRAFNGEFHAESINHESMKDSHQDESVYAAMHASTYEEEKKSWWKLWK